MQLLQNLLKILRSDTLKQWGLCFEILLFFFSEILAHAPPLFYLVHGAELIHSFMSSFFYLKYCQNKNCLSEKLNTLYKQQGYAELCTEIPVLSCKLFLTISLSERKNPKCHCVHPQLFDPAALKLVATGSGFYIRCVSFPKLRGSVCFEIVIQSCLFCQSIWSRSALVFHLGKQTHES